MAQNIRITIAGKTFAVVASDAAQERAMRLAAEHINAKFASLDSRFPDKLFEDKLLLVALGESVSKILLQERLKDVADEAGDLERQIDAYLKDAESNR